MGRGYSRLIELRSTGDYGKEQHVSPEAAQQAIRIASDILGAVAQRHPESFPHP